MTSTSVNKNRELGTFELSGLAVLVGIVAGFGAIIFRWLIAFFHNLFFLGTLSVHYNTLKHTPAGPWGAFIILVPVIGALVVTYLVKNYAPEAKGHGVPEVMEAIYYKKGIIRPIVALIKSVASALSIGTGGSVGREGPIIQIGASFGSSLGQLISMRTWQRITLIAAGAGGGIAATFNTPIGGILFAIEIMMQEVSVRTLVPVSLSTAMATYVGRYFLGSSPAFQIPGMNLSYIDLTNPTSLIFFVLLGLLMGLVSALYIKSIYSTEDFFNGIIKKNQYLRHSLGMLIVGITMYLLFKLTGKYYIEGVGYATVQDILSSNLTVIWMLILLAVLKLLSVSLTLGSGASGGVFSPGLYIGATLGAAYGLLLQYLFPGLSIPVIAFAVAGMAAVIGGSTGAAIAAIVMIFEMTLDYDVIIPMTLTVAISYGIRKMIVSESIYTMKLTRRGRHMPDALQANYHHEIQARNMMDTSFKTIPESHTLKELAAILTEEKDIPWFLRTGKDGTINGVLSRDHCRASLAESDQTTLLKNIEFYPFETVSKTTSLFNITDKTASTHSHIVLVLDGSGQPKEENLCGIITRDHIAQAMEQAMDLFSE